jgi:hypothetical protein
MFVQCMSRRKTEPSLFWSCGYARNKEQKAFPRRCIRDENNECAGVSARDRAATEEMNKRCAEWQESRPGPIGYHRDFKSAVIYAVSLGGDADTIGAMTGALAGACYGIEGIPSQWRETVEQHDHLDALAKRLWEVKMGIGRDPADDEVGENRTAVDAR